MEDVVAASLGECDTPWGISFPALLYVVAMGSRFRKSSQVEKWEAMQRMHGTEDLGLRSHALST